MAGPQSPVWPYDDVTRDSDAKHERAKKVLRLSFIGVLVFAAGWGLVDKWLNRVTYPKAWDPRVARIAADVEQLRGLRFKRPVHVREIPEATFDKSTSTDDSVWQSTAGDEDDYTFVCSDDHRGKWGACKSSRGGEIDPASEVLHIIGVTEQVAVPRMPLSVDNATILARYNDKRKQIEIRGSIAKVTKSLIAHELVHVLQDQHFGFKCDCRSFDQILGARSLTEGDAERIQALYIENQSPEETKGDAKIEEQIDADVNERISDAIATENLSEESVDLTLELGAFPYVEGRQFTEHIVREGGQLALDELFKSPPRSSAEIFQRQVMPTVNIAPVVARGPKYTPKPIGIGAWYWREALRNNDLGIHLDAVSSAWRGEKTLVYQTGFAGNVCFTSRIALGGADDRKIADSAKAFESLAGQLTDGKFEAHLEDEVKTVLIEGCNSNKLSSGGILNACAGLASEERTKCVREKALERFREAKTTNQTVPDENGKIEECFQAGTPEKAAACLQKK